jgi:tRNA-dihydrouridine synthase
LGALGRFEIPIIANGDIFLPADIERCRSETMCRAVLVARGALDNVSIFSGTLRPHADVWREYLQMVCVFR